MTYISHGKPDQKLWLIHKNNLDQKEMVEAKMLVSHDLKRMPTAGAFKFYDKDELPYRIGSQGVTML